MRQIKLTSVAVVSFLAAIAPAQTQLDTAFTFTYQGQVFDNSAPATGTFDLRFTAHNDLVAGDQYGPMLCFDNVPVTDGHFAQPLNFGNILFGEVIWVEVSVRASALPDDCGTGAYTTLSPRQQLTIAPFAGQAITALSATTATTATNATSFAGLAPSFFQNAANINSGLLSDARLSSNVVLGNTAQTISGAKSFSADMSLLGDDSSITFAAADATNSPMIQMFASGTTNGTRMVLAHSPSQATTGLRYNDAADDFEFTNLGTTKLGVDMATGKLRFDDALGGLAFNSSAVSPFPLITLFPTEVSSSNFRYIVAESPADGSTAFGYDAAADTFFFDYNGGDETIYFDMPNGRIGIGQPPLARLQIGGEPGMDGILFPDGILQTSASQWRGDPTGMSFLGGNIGIGTPAPTAALHLSRDFQPNAIRFEGDQIVSAGSSAASGNATVTSVPGSDAVWNNPGFASNINGASATATLTRPSGNALTNDLRFVSLNLNVPANAAITGIKVTVTGNATGNCPECAGYWAMLAYTRRVYLTDGSITSLPRSTSGQNIGVSFGHGSDAWGLALTPAMVNSPNFGVLLDVSMMPYTTDDQTYPCQYQANGCQVPCPTCASSATVSVDGITVTVYYGAPVTATADFTIGIPEGSTEFRVSPSSDFSATSIAVASNGVVNIGPATNPGGPTLTVFGTAAKPGGGSWSTTSDIRLKHDMQPLTGTLDTLLSLHGFSYEYNDDEVRAQRALPGRQVGLIAQDVQRVFPDWVSTRDDGYLMVTERSTTALMIESLRDLRQEKDNGLALLQRQVDALREENNLLRRRLDAIESGRR